LDSAFNEPQKVAGQFVVAAEVVISAARLGDARNRFVVPHLFDFVRKLSARILALINVSESS